VRLAHWLARLGAHGLQMMPTRGLAAEVKHRFKLQVYVEKITPPQLLSAWRKLANPGFQESGQPQVPADTQAQPQPQVGDAQLSPNGATNANAAGSDASSASRPTDDDFFLALQVLNFPALVIPIAHAKSDGIVKRGKSCVFELSSSQLMQLLRDEPARLMALSSRPVPGRKIPKLTLQESANSFELCKGSCLSVGLLEMAPFAMSLLSQCKQDVSETGSAKRRVRPSALVRRTVAMVDLFTQGVVGLVHLVTKFQLLTEPPAARARQHIATMEQGTTTEDLNGGAEESLPQPPIRRLNERAYSEHAYGPYRYYSDDHPTAHIQQQQLESYNQRGYEGRDEDCAEERARIREAIRRTQADIDYLNDILRSERTNMDQLHADYSVQMHPGVENASSLASHQAYNHGFEEYRARMHRLLQPSVVPTSAPSVGRGRGSSSDYPYEDVVSSDDESDYEDEDGEFSYEPEIEVDSDLEEGEHVICCYDENCLRQHQKTPHTSRMWRSRQAREAMVRRPSELVRNEFNRWRSLRRYQLKLHKLMKQVNQLKLAYKAQQQRLETQGRRELLFGGPSTPANKAPYSPPSSLAVPIRPKGAWPSVTPDQELEAQKLAAQLALQARIPDAGQNTGVKSPQRPSSLHGRPVVASPKKNLEVIKERVEREGRLGYPAPSSLAMSEKKLINMLSETALPKVCAEHLAASCKLCLVEYTKDVQADLERQIAPRGHVDPPIQEIAHSVIATSPEVCEYRNSGALIHSPLRSKLPLKDAEQRLATDGYSTPVAHLKRSAFAAPLVGSPRTQQAGQKALAKRVTPGVCGALRSRAQLGLQPIPPPPTLADNSSTGAAVQSASSLNRKRPSTVERAPWNEYFNSKYPPRSHTPNVELHAKDHCRSPPKAIRKVLEGKPLPPGEAPPIITDAVATRRRRKHLEVQLRALDVTKCPACAKLIANEVIPLDVPYDYDTVEDAPRVRDWSSIVCGNCGRGHPGPVVPLAGEQQLQYSPALTNEGYDYYDAEDSSADYEDEFEEEGNDPQPVEFNSSAQYPFPFSPFKTSQQP